MSTFPTKYLAWRLHHALEKLNKYLIWINSYRQDFSYFIKKCFLFQIELDAINSEKNDLEKALQRKHEDLLRVQTDLSTEVERYERRILTLEEESRKNIDHLREEVSYHFLSSVGCTAGGHKILPFCPVLVSESPSGRAEHVVTLIMR